MNSNQEPRDLGWFNNHCLITHYLLAEWMSEVYPAWEQMRDELALSIDRGPVNGSKGTE